MFTRSLFYESPVLLECKRGDNRRRLERYNLYRNAHSLRSLHLSILFSHTSWSSKIIYLIIFASIITMVATINTTSFLFYSLPLWPLVITAVTELRKLHLWRYHLTSWFDYHSAVTECRKVWDGPPAACFHQNSSRGPWVETCGRQDKHDRSFLARCVQNA
jgi:hypothetical protein